MRCDPRMFVLTRQEVTRDALVLARRGLFIYPTDTVYGLGCDARDEELVQELRRLKHRPTQPFSIIAPSVDWVKEHCIIDRNASSWLKRLPGPYTLVLKLKDGAVARSVNPLGDTIGVRLPNHWMSGIVRKLGYPIVTTLVNPDGDVLMTSKDEVDPIVQRAVFAMIDEGLLHGIPSTVVDLSEDLETLDNRIAVHV
jgi:L-threonylcarbamoyladenylate synthase